MSKTTRIVTKLIQMRALINDKAGYITSKDLADMFSISTISKYVKRGFWPKAFARLGNAYIYESDEVKSYLDRAIERAISPKSKKSNVERNAARKNLLMRLLKLLDGLSDNITVGELIDLGLVAGSSTVNNWRKMGVWPEPTKWISNNQAIYNKAEVRAHIVGELRDYEQPRKSDDEIKREEKAKERREIIAKIENDKDTIIALYEMGDSEEILDAITSGKLMADYYTGTPVIQKAEALRYLKKKFS